MKIKLNNISGENNQPQNTYPQQSYQQPSYQQPYSPQNIPQEDMRFAPQGQGINQSNYNGMPQYQTYGDYYEPQPQQPPINNTPPKKSKIGLIIGIICGSVALLGGLFLLWFFVLNKSKVTNGYDSAEKVVEKSFEALNNHSIDDFMDCYIDDKYLDKSKIQEMKKVVQESYFDVELSFNTSTIKYISEDDVNLDTFTYVDTKELSKLNPKNVKSKVINIECSQPIDGDNYVFSENFTFYLAEFDSGWCILYILPDQASVVLISVNGKPVPNEDNTEDTTETTTESNTESDGDTVYGAAENIYYSLMGVFNGANQRDVEYIMKYAVINTNSDFKSGVTEWVNNLKTSDITYDITSVKEGKDKEDIGVWGKYNEFEQSFTVNATVTKDGVKYKVQQKGQVEYIEAENNTVALTYFYLDENVDIIESNTETTNTETTTEVTTENTTESTTEANNTTGLSDDWKSEEFMMDGVVYHLPFNYDLLKDKYTFDMTKYGKTDDYLLNPKDKTSSTIAMENANLDEKFDFWVGFINNTDKSINIKEADIWSVKFDMSWCKTKNYPNIVLPKGITWGSTLDEVKQAYGEPSEEPYYSDSMHYWELHYIDNYDYKLNLTVYDDGGVKEIQLQSYVTD